MALPAFLRSEYFPYTSVEIVPATEPELVARKTDSAPFCDHCDGYAFDGHVCPGEFDLLENQDDQDEEPGSRCSRACGYCGRCS
jgi:hypothetical protein